MLCVLVLLPTDPGIQLLFSLDPPPAVSPLLPPEHLIPGLISLDCLQCLVVLWWRGPWPFCIHFSGNFVMLLTEKSLPCGQNFYLDKLVNLDVESKYWITLTGWSTCVASEATSKQCRFLTLRSKTTCLGHPLSRWAVSSIGYYISWRDLITKVKSILKACPDRFPFRRLPTCQTHK